MKANAKDEVVKRKAQLVAKGFLQRECIDFEEVFALVARIEIIRLVVGIANNNNWSIYKMNFQSAFLNESLEEEVYVE